VAAAIVIADAPRPGLCNTRLETLLGRDGCARLQEALIARALRWAAAIGDPYLAFTPGDAREEIAALVPDGTRLLAQVEGDVGARLAAVTSAVLEEHGGPVVLVGVRTPQLRPVVGRQALEDLARGVDVTVGPAADGGYYLIGLREPHPEVFALPSEAWGAPRVAELTFAAAAAAGLSLGLLRAERHLDAEADVRAFLADPLSPPDIVAVLGLPRR
jgi:rSAM/selenodomain-associated transferase 1